MFELTLQVDGMRCPQCVREVTARLRDVPGVAVVTAAVSRERAVITGSMSTGAVLAVLAGTPYRVRVVADRDGTEAGQGGR